MTARCYLLMLGGVEQHHLECTVEEMTDLLGFSPHVVRIGDDEQTRDAIESGQKSITVIDDEANSEIDMPLKELVGLVVRQRVYDHRGRVMAALKRAHIDKKIRYIWVINSRNQLRRNR